MKLFLSKCIALEVDVLKDWKIHCRCRHVRASFSLEILQSGAVKGLMRCFGVCVAATTIHVADAAAGGFYIVLFSTLEQTHCRWTSCNELDLISGSHWCK